MSIRLTGRANLQGESLEAVTEAFQTATSSLTAQAMAHQHRVVWDTLDIEIETTNYHSAKGELTDRWQELQITALCVEEPSDDA